MGLIDEIDRLGQQGFCCIWNYNHAERVDLLRAMCDRLLLFKSHLKEEDDLKALVAWGESTTVADFLDFKVPGLGFSTFQYLRILCGASTVKPDVHIRRAFLEGVGRKVNDSGIVALYEVAAARLQVPAQKLDYAIWNYYSERARNSQTCPK